MKKLIFIILYLCFCKNINAQYKSIFGNSSTQWVFEWHNLNIDQQDTVYVVKDTFVLGYNWKKIGVSRQSNIYTNALLREDTTLGKVWYKQLGVVGTDSITKLLFDFSLNVGDTFDVSNVWTGGPNVTTAAENTVDSVYYINGHKHILFKNASNISGINLFIEGIGGNIGILWKQYSSIFQAQYLLCSYKDGIQTFYQNIIHNGNCDVFDVSFVDEDAVLQSKIIIYPNPTYSTLKIDVKDLEIIEYSIFNLYGESLQNGHFHNNISITNLANGQYILKLMTKNNTDLYKVFIKQ